jgi:hypothetical protein
LTSVLEDFGQLREPVALVAGNDARYPVDPKRGPDAVKKGYLELPGIELDPSILQPLVHIYNDRDIVTSFIYPWFH